MEGQVFACSWKKQGNLYKVWIKKRPKLSAQGKTFNQADKRLWAVIIDATGDGESIREYDPPEPDSETRIEAGIPAAIPSALRVETLTKRKRRKPEPLDTNAKIKRRFEQRVNQHFSFLRDMGFKPPKFTSEFNQLTGMAWNARFESKKRTLDIELGKAYEEYSNSASFEINTKPPVDQFEAFMSTMYFALKHRDLMNKLAELALTSTLDEVMELEFPIYADLFRGELAPVLTGAKWHDEYDLYRDD